MKISKIEKRSRKIFDKLHIVQAGDKKIFHRLTALLSVDYLKVPKNFFAGKICLDAGCGSNANATYSMLKAGAKEVYAFDLDESIFNTAVKVLEEFDGKYKLSVGSVLKINFPDEFFDFTHCAGVLHHTTDSYKGLKELARVTKKGGVLYISVYGSGGLIRDVEIFFRDKYVRDPKFKRFIDNFNGDYLMEMWDWVVSSMLAHGDKWGRLIPRFLAKQMFDEDLVLTIKDRVTAPLYHQSTEKELTEWLRNNGFSKIERLKRYPKQNNIRKFLNPFYFDYGHKFSRLLYGEGQPQLKAVKVK